MKTSAKDFPQLDPKEEEEFTFVQGLKRHDGDLSQMLAIKEPDNIPDIFLHPVVPDRSVRLELDQSNKVKGRFHNYKIVKEIPDSLVSTEDLRILIFRDSYTNYLVGKISEHFKRSTYIWTNRFDPQEVLKEKPDIVAEITLERYIHDWIEGNPQSIAE